MTFDAIPKLKFWNSILIFKQFYTQESHMSIAIFWNSGSLSRLQVFYAALYRENHDFRKPPQFFGSTEFVE
jgi:hypothetical protein